MGLSTIAEKDGVGIDSAGGVADSVTGWIVSTAAAKVGVGSVSAGSVADSVTSTESSGALKQSGQ